MGSYSAVAVFLQLVGCKEIKVAFYAVCPSDETTF